MTRDLILNIHSLSGIAIFLIGILQLLLKKGGLLHRRLGNTYLLLWLFLLITGAYLGGPLITLVGIFGFYYALTGARFGHLKLQPITYFDQAIFVVGGLIALSMLYYSVVLYLSKDTSFAVIFLVFGLLFLNSTAQDMAKYIFKRPLKKEDLGKNDWFFEHFIRMSISFIAAVTAFTSIQNLFLHNTLNFIVPTVIGVVLIGMAKKSYKRKFNIE